MASNTAMTACELVQNLSADNQVKQVNDKEIQIKVYKKRWFMLIVICLANITNAINWICYSSIANKTGEFYHISFEQVNYLSLAYLVLTIPIGLFSFVLIDLFGLRLSIFIGVWFNFIGALIRMLSSFDHADSTPLFKKSNQYLVLMVGQCLCAVAQPFVIFISTKFANTWFADDQRALANTIALSSNILGILLGAFLSPIFINIQSPVLNSMNILNITFCLMSSIPGLLSIFIARSTPLLPPSYSMIQNNSIKIKNSSFKKDLSSYFKQCSKLLKSREFIILMICFGLGVGINNSLTTLAEQILCTRGYSNEDAGYIIAIMFGSGIFGSILIGVALDKTKKFEEAAKSCFLVSSLLYITLVILSAANSQNKFVYYAIYITAGIFGFFSLPLLPICMEMSIECVYPIPEATPTGLLLIFGQIFGSILIIGYPKIASKMDTSSNDYLKIQKCLTPLVNSTSGVKTVESDMKLIVLDFSLPLFIMGAFFFLASIFFCIFFKSSYLRCQIDRDKKLDQVETKDLIE